MGIEVPAGNTYDKYGTSNPFYRRLMSAYTLQLRDLIEGLKPSRVLEVGCGEGHVVGLTRNMFPGVAFSALDLSHPIVLGASALHPGVQFVCGDAIRLPYDSNSIDLIIAVETLEHIPDAESAIVELRRVSRGHVLLSVPREPIWRVLNILRGAYLGSLGNTPGHVRHWSQRGFIRWAGKRLQIVEVRAPFPWTMVLCRSD